MNYLAHIIFLSLLLMAASTILYAAEEGEELYKSSGCTSCHGARGEKSPMPGSQMLSGQDKDMLVQIMKAIRDGHRTQGMSSIMHPDLQMMSDTDLEAVADWLTRGEQ